MIFKIPSSFTAACQSHSLQCSIGVDQNRREAIVSQHQAEPVFGGAPKIAPVSLRLKVAYHSPKLLRTKTRLAQTPPRKRASSCDMSSSTENQETKTYSGRCHCQAIIFEVTIPPLETGATEVMQCNCSICMKKGYWLLYPLREDVKFLKGEDQLKDYYFATKTRAHRFCPECGTSVLIDYKNVQHEKLKGRLGISVSACSYTVGIGPQSKSENRCEHSTT